MHTRLTKQDCGQLRAILELIQTALNADSDAKASELLIKTAFVLSPDTLQRIKEALRDAGNTPG